MRKGRRVPRPKAPRLARRLRAGSGVADRFSARDTAIMAAVAVAFIGAFAFALSKPTARAFSSPPQTIAQTASPATSQPTQELSTSEPRTLAKTSSSDTDFICDEARVTDGDTLRCGPLRIRLASIDAPEMPGHCRRGRTCVDGDPYASKANLDRLMASGVVQCRQTDTDRYGRIVALCEVGGRDLSCAQVQDGHAIIRYGELACPVG
ncbi:Succinoglycan biosynthesis protein ExoI [compost metagenome]